MNLQIKQAGLNIQLDKFTGNIGLTYRYPIKAMHFLEFQELEKELGIKVQVLEFKDKKTGNIKTRNACYLNLYGNSNEVLPKFAYIQYELMKYSRFFKSAHLQREIANLKEASLHLFKHKTNDSIPKNETV